MVNGKTPSIDFKDDLYNIDINPEVSNELGKIFRELHPTLSNKLGKAFIFGTGGEIPNDFNDLFYNPNNPNNKTN